MKKGLVYYTDNNPNPFLLDTCRKNLINVSEGKIDDIVSVSSEPTDLGRNYILNDIPRGPLQIFKKILLGLEKSEADIVFLIEHDILYHPTHFDFVPPKKNIFYYNRNRWAVSPVDGKAVFYQTNVISLLVAYRDLLIEHYKRVVEFNERVGWRSRYGYSPPKGLPSELRQGKYKTWMGEGACLDIRHEDTYTRVRMTKDQFRSERSCRDWAETYDIPNWGEIKPNWTEWLRRINIGSFQFKETLNG